LPAETVTTPRARSSADSVSSLLSAPRCLKLPVNCRFSNFSQISQPVSSESVADGRNGVGGSASRSRPAAASTSARWTCGVSGCGQGSGCGEDIRGHHRTRAGSA
jgi:hypothetical protein